MSTILKKNSFSQQTRSKKKIKYRRKRCRGPDEWRSFHPGKPFSEQKKTRSFATFLVVSYLFIFFIFRSSVYGITGQRHAATGRQFERDIRFPGTIGFSVGTVRAIFRKRKIHVYTSLFYIIFHYSYRSASVGSRGTVYVRDLNDQGRWQRVPSPRVN